MMTRDEFATKVRTTVVTHCEQAKQRVPAFVRTHYRSLWPVMRRGIKTPLDVPFMPLNAAAWVSRKLGWRDFSRVPPTIKELQRLFLDEVFQVEALEAKLRALDAELCRDLEAALDNLRRSHGLASMTVEEVEALIMERMRASTELSDELKNVIALVATALATYLVLGQVKDSLYPVGVVAAEAVFMAQTGILGGLYYGIFGIPAYVGIVGGVAALGIGMVVLPLVGAFVEYGINHLLKLEDRFCRAIDDICVRLLDGLEPGPDHSPAGVAARLLRRFEQVFELYKLVSAAVARAKR